MNSTAWLFASTPALLILGAWMIWLGRFRWDQPTQSMWRLLSWALGVMAMITGGVLTVVFVVAVVKA